MDTVVRHTPSGTYLNDTLFLLTLGSRVKTTHLE